MKYFSHGFITVFRDLPFAAKPFSDQFDPNITKYQLLRGKLPQDLLVIGIMFFICFYIKPNLAYYQSNEPNSLFT